MEPTVTADFYPVDLGEWLALCDLAKVPYVPAMEIARASTLGIQEGEVEPERVRQFWLSIRDADVDYPAGFMLRWSCCSMERVKSRLARGSAEWHPDFMQLSVNDFRADMMIEDFDRPTIAAYVRPWLQFAMEGQYPVEYRAFVRENALLGVSSYYPQRPLIKADQTTLDIRTVSSFVRRLIDRQRKPVLSPHLAREMDLTLNCWTADFARLPSGAIVFLEGGPAHGKHWGSHPCCFRDGEIEGVALSDRNTTDETFS